MWKILRGTFEYDLFLKHIQQTEQIASCCIFNSPKDYPCLVKQTYIEEAVVGITFVYVTDAKAFINIVNNGGVL
jgi:hypothetical protein